MKLNLWTTQIVARACSATHALAHTVTHTQSKYTLEHKNKYYWHVFLHFSKSGAYVVQSGFVSRWLRGSVSGHLTRLIRCLLGIWSRRLWDRIWPFSTASWQVRQNLVSVLAYILSRER